MIYLDNAATTPVIKSVLDAAMPYMKDRFFNPGALYGEARSVNRDIYESRSKVARYLFGAPTENIIFTSGGSEANNMVFNGLRKHLLDDGKTHILISSIEHDSVVGAANALKEYGFSVECIPVSREGAVCSETVEKMIRDDTGLVSVMYVNNETGAVNPVSEIGNICNERGVLFHTDCVQAAGTQSINVDKIKCDFASVSAHKIHSLKGTGALYVRDFSMIDPLIFGGGEQEFGMRGGTENVPGIIAMGEAAELCVRGFHENLIRVSTLKQYFYTELLSALKTQGVSDEIVHVNGPSPVSPGKVLNVRFDGVDNESLILTLEAFGICVSAGSACRSHEIEPSRVLRAMGCSDEEARNSVRVSFSILNAEQEIKQAAAAFAASVGMLLGGIGDNV